MEATQYSGLRNELVGIEESSGPTLQLSTSGGIVKKPHLARRGGFNAEITDIECAKLEDPHSRNAYYAELTTFWKALGNALANFAWAILMSTPVGRKAVKVSKAFWRHRWWYGPRQWKFWTRRAWAEPERFRLRRRVRTARQTWDDYVEKARARATATAATGTVSTLRRRRTTQPSEDETRQRLYSMSPTPTPATSVYDDFLRGEVMSDDEDAEQDWADDATDSDATMTVMADDEEVPEHDPDLYRDLMQQRDAEPTTDLQPVLFAHLTSSSASPLTRRQYASLLSSTSTSRALTPTRMEEVIRDRRAVMAGRETDEWDDERRKSCIVCMTEPRDTILWPCR